jgi:acyl phosphate:glycerol-3-phosphate acyltransferase
MSGLLIALTVAAYFLGAVPVSYLAARYIDGIDLRRHGTGQVGAGNFYRLTKSRKTGLAVGAFDVIKGGLMMWLAAAAGLPPEQLLIIGAAVVAGHNWPVFLRFSGGRGIGITLGIILFFPLITGFTFWGFFTMLIPLIGGTALLRSSPLPVLLAVASVPVASWLGGDPPAVVFGYLGILLIVIIKRIMSNPSSGTPKINKSKLLLNRLLFDRDTSDRKRWMHRKPSAKKEAETGE